MVRSLDLIQLKVRYTENPWYTFQVGIRQLHTDIRLNGECEQSLQDYRVIVDALLSRDPEVAASIMQNLVNIISKSLNKNVLQERSEPNRIEG